MYGWLWRKLPGGWQVKLLESVVMIAVISVVLVVYVFPWIEPKLPFSDNTVGGGGSASTPSAAPVPTGTSPTQIQPNPGPTDVLPGD